MLIWFLGTPGEIVSDVPLIVWPFSDCDDDLHATTKRTLPPSLPSKLSNDRIRRGKHRGETKGKRVWHGISTRADNEGFSRLNSSNSQLLFQTQCFHHPLCQRAIGQDLHHPLCVNSWTFWTDIIKKSILNFTNDLSKNLQWFCVWLITALLPWWVTPLVLHEGHKVTAANQDEWQGEWPSLFSGACEQAACFGPPAT